MRKIYTIFGGTFDPIHNGHLLLMEKLAQQICLEQIILLPNNISFHKPSPKANVKHRLEMLSRAINNNNLFNIDTRQVIRDVPSLMANTLQEFRIEYGFTQPLALIIGEDSFLTLPTWYRWKDILKLCHILVCQRQCTNLQINNNNRKWLSKYIVNDVNKLYEIPAGYIWLSNTPLLNISATEIRNRLYTKKSCENLVPKVVLDYIQKTGLYLESKSPISIL